MNSKPKVSIIVPMYNCVEYAPQCVESIINQTYSNWELWLVHGDSNDGTENVCMEYEKRDTRIKNIFHIDGLVSARNVGYEHATGDWIMYIDGDDWINTDTLENVFIELDKLDKPVDVVFWKYVQELNGREISDKWGWSCSDPVHLYEGDECVELARNTLIYKSGIAEAYGKMVRAEYAYDHSLMHDKRLRQGMEGVEYALRVFYYAERALFINRNLYHYRYNPKSLSKVGSERNAQCISESAIVISNTISSFKRKEDFTAAMYQRVMYALIASAIGIYFHPDNNESYKIRSKKFSDSIEENPVYMAALKYCDMSMFDKKRQFTTFCIKHKFYFMIQLVSEAKQFMLERGYFNY
ncbi:glycosyltransferase family 2 protein [Phocaeicola sp.]